jgi:hypothetical protein
MLLSVVKSVLLCVANMDACLLLNCFQCDCRNAKIVTGGGSVELQVHEHAGEVEIDASKGTVTLYFSEQISGQV